MEERANQRAERKKEIEELKRKKEEEKMVRDSGVASLEFTMNTTTPICKIMAKSG